MAQTDTVDFGELYAYTMVDIYTREACVIIKTTLDAKDGAKALEEQLRYFKKFDLIQRDGGSEFMADWEYEVTKRGIKIRTARPYRKNEQAYIESFNRTLRKECLGWRKYKKADLEKVQQRVNEYLKYYNQIRPHLSIDMKSPIHLLSHLR